MEFETKRLEITRWSDDEPADPLRKLLTPAVLAHLPPALQQRDPKAWIADRLNESDVFAVLAEGRLIGVVLLAKLDPPHVGFLLAEEVWGQGYASELVRGLVDAMPGSALRAGVARDNPASIRVLEKAGFTVCEEGPDRLMFEISLS